MEVALLLLLLLLLVEVMEVVVLVSLSDSEVLVVVWRLPQSQVELVLAGLGTVQGAAVCGETRPGISVAVSGQL